MLNFQIDYFYQQINSEVLNLVRVGPKDGVDFIGGNYAASTLIYATSLHYHKYYLVFKTTEFSLFFLMQQMSGVLIMMAAIERWWQN